MRKLSVLVVLALAGWLGYGTAPGQEAAGTILFCQHRQFNIPFHRVPNAGNVKQLRLFYSLDQGKSWHPSSVVAPEKRHFPFLTDRDGYYWFTVQTTDRQGRLTPATLDGAAPSLKVVVDTQPPTVTLQALPPRNGDVGVSWAVRDDNLDLALPDCLRLEYRLAGRGNWLPLPVTPVNNHYYWNPQSNGLVEVRLLARDRAGNRGEGTTTVSLSGKTPPPDPGPGPGVRQAAEPTGAPGLEERRLVNSKRITLNYEIKEKGPSGVSVVELWYTMDGRSWNRYPARFGEEPNITFDVNGEGIYGITLLAKSGVGLGDRPPQIGDRPQLWIEVDMTKPRVQLHGVTVGTGADKGKLTVTWAATDKNLEKRPITLSYAEQLTGPWKSYAEKLPNVGRHVWAMPAEVPYQFHVRVEAADRAGNIGEAATEDLVKVDLSTPKVNILKVAPAGK